MANGERPSRTSKVLAGVKESMTPARSLAIVCVLLAFVGVWVDSKDWLTAWMPNVVVGAITVALTITVIEWVIRTERRRALRPRFDYLLDGLGPVLRIKGMLQEIVTDYTQVHLSNYRDIPDNGLAMIEQWLTDHELEDTRPTRTTNTRDPS